MTNEPEKKRIARRRPPAKPREDGFVFEVVDGFAQLTPEQRKWPVVQTGIPLPTPNNPPNDAGEQPTEKT